MSGTVNCTFDLTKDGIQAGYLKVGDSTNNSGWTTYNVPIISIKNGAGPRALVLAGNHGDEYEGQIAATTLSRDLKPEQIKGQVIIIPCLSQEASRGGTRHWPDGVNFNRIFPGSEDGPVSSKLAYYLTHELFPKVDAVMDIHSGGRGHVFKTNISIKRFNYKLCALDDFHGTTCLYLPRLEHVNCWSIPRGLWRCIASFLLGSFRSCTSTRHGGGCSRLAMDS